MASATISPKFQVVIPKAVREKLHLKSGQKITVITKGGVIPEKPPGVLQRFFEGQRIREEDEER
ncbi:MAG: AbrB/MazE/SpoVT family DNA-binding domain-containing protein [Thermodesulfovibrionales bacterium]